MGPKRSTRFSSAPPFNNLPGAGAAPWFRERLVQECLARGLVPPPEEEPDFPIADDDSDSDMTETYDYPLRSDGPTASLAPEASRAASVAPTEPESVVSAAMLHAVNRADEINRNLITKLTEQIQLQLNLISALTDRVIELEHVVLNKPHQAGSECTAPPPPPAAAPATPAAPPPPAPPPPQS